MQTSIKVSELSYDSSICLAFPKDFAPADANVFIATAQMRRFICIE